jgi:hypothetical protein
MADAEKEIEVYLMVRESKVAIPEFKSIDAGHLVRNARTNCKTLRLRMRKICPLTV